MDPELQNSVLWRNDRHYNITINAHQEFGDIMERQHATERATNRTRNDDSYLSGHQAVGGLAILVNPFSRLSKALPLWYDLWTPHFCAISIMNGDQMNIICNVCAYAPQEANERKVIYYGEEIEGSR